ncbi:MAG: hypothetical protein GX330_00895 [Bacteroidales bacterium]|nr:hypothetical protein [Bacteroidales bacterium]
MRNIVLFICSLSLFIACNRTHEKVIASVYDETLTISDLQAMVPEFDLQSDSIEIQSHYIDTWIQKQVLLQEAKEYLSRKEQNFDQELKEYHQSLLIFAYENKKSNDLLKKEISENELRQYYEDHKTEFEMRKNIVKINYIKFPIDFKQAETAKKLLFLDNRSEKDQKKLENLCNNFAQNMYMKNKWLLFEDILKEIPINAYNQEHYLQQNRNIELRDTSSIYLIKIIDFKINETYFPFDVVKDNIKEIMLNHRRQELLKQIRKEAFEKAKKQHAIEINIH